MAGSMKKKGWQDFVAIDPFISISAFRKRPISPDSPLCLRHSTCTCPWCDKCPGSQEAQMVWMSLDTAQHPKRIQKDTNQHPTTPGPGNRRSSTRAEVQLLNIKLMNGDGRESSENTWFTFIPRTKWWFSRMFVDSIPIVARESISAGDDTLSDNSSIGTSFWHHVGV